MLTKRATEYLGTLKRLPSLPSVHVERSLFEQGAPCFPAWLDFQDRYAGYVEELGRDSAIWGIVHERPHWLSPGRVEVDREPHAPVWYVTCADVHPSYAYQLDDKGGFAPPAATSFDIHVERNAVVWAFFREGRAERLSPKELKDSNIRALLRQQIASQQEIGIISEASDEHLRYHGSKNQIVVEDLRKGSIWTAWRRV